MGLDPPQYVVDGLGQRVVHPNQLGLQCQSRNFGPLPALYIKPSERVSVLLHGDLQNRAQRAFVREREVWGSGGSSWRRLAYPSEPRRHGPPTAGVADGAYGLFSGVLNPSSAPEGHGFEESCASGGIPLPPIVVQLAV